MARGRMLSKSLSTSVKRAALHEVAGPLAEFAQSLYDLLLAHADDFGREPGDLFTVKHRVDPASPRPLSDFAAALTALQQVGMIAWYDGLVDGLETQCIEIWNFERYQGGLQKRTKSRFPEPPPGSYRNFHEVLGMSNHTWFPSSPPSTPPLPLRKGTEGKGREEKGRELSTAPQTARGVENSSHSTSAEECVEVITTLVLKDILPMGLADNDLIEVTKSRCAQLHIPYNSGVVRKAIDSALVRRSLPSQP